MWALSQIAHSSSHQLLTVLALLDKTLTLLVKKMPKELLGGFEHRVLLATVQIGERAYTAAIVDELERRTGRQVAPSAVYIALQRLEHRGLVISQVRREAEVGDKRPRRYFRATPEAIGMLLEARRELEALWQGLEVLEGGS